MVEIKSPVIEREITLAELKKFKPSKDIERSLIKSVRPSLFGDEVIVETIKTQKTIKTKPKKTKSTKPRKVLKKPRAKGIKKLSATKLIEQMGRESSGRLVREVPSPYVNPVQDTRSQFFREEFKTEQKKAFGGFL
jgi:hypothetical protein